MGQFLVIGIATRITADKLRVEKEFKDIKYFKTLFEKKINSAGIYQLSETENTIELRLKSEIAEQEWPDFIQAFYSLRYQPHENDEIIEYLYQRKTLKEWISLGEEKLYQNYQLANLHYYIHDYHFNCNIPILMNMMVLSLDGKIIMECYDELFAFFTRLIRERLSNYRLANSLCVDIIG